MASTGARRGRGSSGPTCSAGVRFNPFDFFQYGPYLVPRFYRTDAVRAVGGFERDPDGQGRYYEDKLILLKLAAVGRFAHVDRVLYHIRLHGDNLTRPEERARLNRIKRAMYERIMAAWGNPYTIVWKEHPEGWLDVDRLVPNSGAMANGVTPPPADGATTE